MNLIFVNNISKLEVAGGFLQTLSVLWHSLDKGGATFLAALIAAFISLLSLIFSMLAARSQTRLTARLTDWTNLGKEGRDYKLKQLTDFYDPVYTLLSVNRSIFDRIGPISATRRDQRFDDAETAEVWRRLSETVILPNNERLCTIIEANLHYIAEDDDESAYLGFLTHAHAYKVFKQHPYEAYKLFAYPKNFLIGVHAAREKIRASLGELYKTKEK